MDEIQNDPVQKKPGMKRPTVGQMIWWGLGLIFAIGLFFFLRNFIACWKLTSLAGVAPSSCPGATITVPNAQGTLVPVTPGVTVSAPQVELPIPWDGASRVNILFMGLDYRDVTDAAGFATQGPARTDTMILFTIDPLTKTAGAISIPRDLWINIPGFGYGKINQAYYFGELYKLPGGGAQLAMDTVSSFLGVKIDYFAWIEFSTFINVIDKIGGVYICIPAPITVGRYDQDGVDNLPAGCQTLNGIDALGYARNRYTVNGDVDRSSRQMQVIKALRDKIASPDNWATLVTESPALYQEFSKGIHTNLSLTDGLKLAALLREIPSDKIQLKVIDYTMMTDTKSPDGLDILRPFTDKVRVLRDQVFGGSTLAPAASGDPTQLMKAEAARVVVINGTGTAGLAKKTGDYLTAQGMNVIAVGNTTNYPDNYKSPFPDRTIIIVHSGKPYVIKYLQALMKFDSSSQIIFNFDPGAPEDILIGLGYDWTVPQ
jgi:LCP family protein required for cell wall assembly